MKFNTDKQSEPKCRKSGVHVPQAKNCNSGGEGDNKVMIFITLTSRDVYFKMRTVFRSLLFKSEAWKLLLLNILSVLLVVFHKKVMCKSKHEN